MHAYHKWWMDFVSCNGGLRLIWSWKYYGTCVRITQKEQVSYSITKYYLCAQGFIALSHWLFNYNWLVYHSTPNQHFLPLWRSGVILQGGTSINKITNKTKQPQSTLWSANSVIGNSFIFLRLIRSVFYNINFLIVDNTPNGCWGYTLVTMEVMKIVAHFISPLPNWGHFHIDHR